ncbi:MAG: biotin--[acetyl-CoA-carboxylase] ligase [Bacteroidetes bacterium]|nr:MAG: biotin--[acetyl-CoA-carboxylase] ligase [Bacteroidota bacterium]
MQSLSQTLITLPIVDSTNNYAMAQAHARLAKEGTIYFALEQNAGKGQRGKVWKTEPGSNIIISLVLQPEMISPLYNFLLNASIALACSDFLKSIAGTDIKIKWPNDLYWRDRKAGGILIENIIHGKKWLYAIVGIGMNINQTEFDPSIPNPVSIKQITGKNHDIPSLIFQLVSNIDSRYFSLKNGQTSKILDEYNGELFRKNEIVKLKKADKLFEATIMNVSSQGKLLVVADDSQMEFDFGEVEWVI